MDIPYVFAGTAIGTALAAGAISYAVAERMVAPVYKTGRRPGGLRSLGTLVIALPAAVLIVPAYAAGYTAGVVWRGMQLFGVSILEGFNSGAKDYSA